MNRNLVPTCPSVVCEPLADHDDHSAPLADLQVLRARLSAWKPDSTLDGLVSNVSDAVERITAEHAGMADELLSVYEQLGVVFEVTRRLSTVQDEAGVVDLFVDSLRHSFANCEVSVARPRQRAGASNPYGHQHDLQAVDRSPDDWLETLVRRAVKEAKVLVDRPAESIMTKGMGEALVGPVFAGETFVCAMTLTRADTGEAFRASDMLLLEALTSFCGDLIRNHRLLRELREMSITMVRSLVSAVDQKDEYTSGHSLRVGYYATLLGEAWGLGDADLQMLQWSALLHDVGKIGIRDDVLKKVGKLTTEEFNHIKEHPVRSHKVVKEVPQLAQALDGVLHHHERYDGTGYPHGLVGENIPLQARIIQVADIFDALTSSRSYRPAFHWRKALDILKEEAGQTVDPHLQNVFDRLIHKTLDGDPDGWRELVERADRFTQAEEDHGCGPGGT